MSTAAIIAIAVAALLLLLLAGGFLVSRRRTQGGDWSRHVAEADQALEQARATDKGWDRALLDGAVREALEGERPGVAYSELHLVLVDDRPGVDHDRAHYVATSADGETKIVLGRDADGGWKLESVS